jgi:RNA polymerase sigma factor for flagellar operon FliA
MKQEIGGLTPAQAYASSPAEVERRVRQFMPLVQKQAWHVHSLATTELELEDMVQIGLIALTQCAQRHAGPTDDGFAAYAKLRVRGAMFDYVRKTLPDSRSAVKNRRILEGASEQLAERLGRPPSPAEIAEELGWSAEELRHVEASRAQLSSIDDSYDESNSAFTDAGPNPFEVLAQLDDREAVLAALKQMPERLQLVLQLFFVEELNLTEIAEVLEVSVPRVHQLRGQALKKMRGILEQG